ncbi:hypothetical protein ACFWRG_21715 [Micromonospora tulbaghiae]
MNVFGHVAALYERERPAYPARVADAIVAYLRTTLPLARNDAGVMA